MGTDHHEQVVDIDTDGLLDVLKNEVPEPLLAIASHVVSSLVMDPTRRGMQFTLRVGDVLVSRPKGDHRYLAVTLASAVSEINVLVDHDDEVLVLVIRSNGGLTGRAVKLADLDPDIVASEVRSHLWGQN